MKLLDAITRLFKPQAGGASVPSEALRAMDLGRTRIVFVEGKPSGQMLHLDRLVVVPIAPDTPLPLALKDLFEKNKCESHNVQLSLKSPQVVTRLLRFPHMNEKELRGVIQYEIEQYVPYESKDLYIDLAVLQESIKTEQGEVSEVFVAVAKKDYLDSLIKQFKDAQVELGGVDVDILACMKCLEFFYPEEFSGHTAVLDMGLLVTTLGVVRKGLPRFVRDLSFGTQDVLKKLKNRANLSDSEMQDFLSGKRVVAETERAIFFDSIENLVNDVKVSFDYYRDQSEDAASADKLFLCGLGSGQAFIAEALQRALDIPVTVLDISAKLELGPEVSPEVLTPIKDDLQVAVGLLLREHD